jgi:hypothetical protein
MTGYIPLHNLPPDTNVTYDINYINCTTGKETSFRLYDYDIQSSNESQGLNQSELDEIDILVLCYQGSSDKSKRFLREAYSERLRSKWPNAPVMLASCSFDQVYDDLSGDQQVQIAQTLDDELMSEIRPSKLVHCSSLKNFNIESLFVESFKIAASHSQNNTLATKTEEQQLPQPGTTLSKKHDLRIQEKVSNKRHQVTLISKTRHGFEDEYSRMEDILMIKQLNLSGKSFSTIVTLFGLACFVFYYITYKYCMESSVGFDCNHQSILHSGLGMLEQSTASVPEHNKSTLIGVLARMFGH